MGESYRRTNTLDEAMLTTQKMHITCFSTWHVTPVMHISIMILLLTVFLRGTSNVSAHPSGGGGGGGGEGDQTFTPTFQAASCPFTLGAGIVEGQQVRCGYVTVPANHHVNNGEMMRLAVAIFKAPQYMQSRDPAPVLRLEGGPGGSSLENVATAITTQNYQHIIYHHDLILLDQRGVGYSLPSLACPEITVLGTNLLVMNEESVRACYHRLVSEGINLSDFNSLQNAADVADVIHALGYQQMTLNGVSYGTRLALTVMRLYPHVVRAAVLDSVYPLTKNRAALAATAQRAFTQLFQRCAEDASCNARYPDLQHVFYQVVDRLNAHAIRLSFTDASTKQVYTIPSFTGNDLIATIDATFYTPPIIPFLPKLIYQVKMQNYTLLSAIYSTFPSSVTYWGMFFSTECSEDWPFLTQQDIETSLQGVTPQLARAFGAREQMEYNVCQFWHVQPVPVAQKQPVYSDIPALILAGAFDPITPPSYGREVARHLKNSYYYLFPNMGHGVQYHSACADQIVSAFEDQPWQRPASSCLAHVSELTFQ